MSDLLTFAIIYAILKVCEGVSINLLSSTVFESIKDKISKKKGKSEKELLKDVIQELKNSGIGDDIIKAITEKEDEILSVSFEYYSEIRNDTEEIKRLSQLLTEKVDEMKEEQIEIPKKTAELLDRVSDLYLKPTYKIFNRDLEGIKDVLGTRFTEGYVERPETDRLDICQNIVIYGKPGIGKTTEIYRIIKRYNPELVVIITNAFREPDVYRLLREDLGDNFLVVWDDFHDNSKLFEETIYKLRNEFDNFYVLCAARSTEKEKIKEELSLEFWKKANFTEKVDLHEFTREQCIELIRMCCEEFNVAASEDVILALADKTLRSDGTPFYIVSVLIDYRDANIRMSDIESFPSKVVDVWKYKISFLSTNERTLLDCLKLLKMIHTPPYKAIVNEMYENFFGKSKADLFGAIESLEWKIWLKEEEYTYSSFDVQLEALEIKIKSGMFNAFKQFVDCKELDGLKQFYKSSLFFGMSYYYSEKIKESKTKAELSFNLEKAIEYIEEAIGIGRELGLKAEVATSLNNASNRYSDLAGLEETKEARKEQLDIAVDYIEEAIGIRRELGLKADVAMSLNNASRFYSYLAGLEETKEARKEQLDIAVDYIEEAIGIRRELGLKAEVAGSLNNASSFYSYLAGLEETKEARKEQLDKTVDYIEEAIGIGRELGLKAEVATSLNNASNRYSDLAGLEETKEARKEQLDIAVDYIEEAIGIRRELGLKAEVAMSLNNASNRYSDLAALEETKEGRKEQLDTTIEYIEEAIGIYKELGLKAEVAMSLNNASNFYSDLAGLEETKEARKEQLDIAVDYIEEAIGIYKELGLKAEVATSLNNASNFYSDLAGLEETKEARKEQLDIAVDYIEEAIGIYKELGLKADVAMSLNNASNCYSYLAGLELTKEARKEQLDKAVDYIEKAIGIRRELGLKADVAGSLNNASSFYSDLAGLEETKEARKEQLDIAVDYIEEAIGIRRELGLKADVAGSMNNASLRYSDLAGLEETKEARKEQLDIAVKYIEEAIGIRRELGLTADVATSLNNASNCYSDLAAIEETKEGRKEQLDKAIEYIEEAIGIYKELGLKAEVATSLNNASNRYSDLAAIEETKEGRKEQLDKAIKYIEEAIGIKRELGLKANLAHSLAISVFVFNEYIALDAKYFMKAAVNCDEAIKIFLDVGMVYKAKPLIPYGIHFHETLFEIDGDERHKQVMEVYKSTGS